MPVVAWSIDASGASAGAAQFEAAQGRITRIVREHTAALEAQEAAVRRTAGAGAGAAQVVQLEQVRAARERVTSAEREATRSAQQLARETLASQRALERVQSALGGAERGAAQYAARERDLQRAIAAGLVTEERAAALRVGLANVTTAASVNSRDLRLNMQGLNGSMTELLRLFTLAGGSGGPIASTALQIANAAAAAQKLQAGSATLGALGLGLGIATAGAAIIGAKVGSEVLESSRELEALLDQARALGATVEELQRLDFAAAAEGVRNLFGNLEQLTRRLGDGSEETAAALDKLGLSLRDLQGLGVERQIQLIADGFVEIEDKGTRASVAADLFGRSGLSMGNLLEQGAAGVDALGDSAERAGIVFSTSTAKAADELSDKFDLLGRVGASILDRAFLDLIPTMTRVADLLLKGAIAAGEFFGAINQQHGASGSWGDPIRDVGDAAADAAPKIAKLTDEQRAFNALVARNEAEFDARRNAPTDTTELDRAVDAIRKQESDRERALDDRRRLLERENAEVARAAEAQARAFQEPFLEAGRNVQNAISDSIHGALTGEVQSVEEFSDAFLDIIARMAAEAATLLVFRPVVEGFASGGAGGGGLGGLSSLLGGIGGPPSPAESREATRETAQTQALETNADLLRRLGATEEQIHEVGLTTAEATAKTAANTTGLANLLGNALASLGAGAAGTAAGLGVNQQFGGNAIGGLVGGAAGSIVGSLFGPIGSAAGGFLGSAIIGSIVPIVSDLIKFQNPIADTNKTERAVRIAVLGQMSPVTSILLRLLLGDGSARPAAAQLLTAPFGSDAGSLFAAGQSARSPFGLVGFSAVGSARTSGERRFAEAIAQFDTALAAHIDPGLTDEIAEALQTTPALRANDIRTFDNEFAVLLADRARLIARIAFAGQTPATNLDALFEQFLPTSGGNSGASPNDIFEGFRSLSELFESFGTGLRELRGEDFTDAESALKSLRDKFGELVAPAQVLGISLEDLNAALSQGQAALRQGFIDSLRGDTLELIDPFRAAVQQIGEEEARLLREAQALGTGFAEVAEFIAQSREQLAERTLQPVTQLLEGLQLSRLGPLEQLGALESRFETARAGTDAGALAGAAQDLLTVSEQVFGRTSLFFERQTFIEASLEAFAERIRTEANETPSAIQSQTQVLAANQEEQTVFLAAQLAEAKAMNAKLDRLEQATRDLYARVLAQGGTR